jgi:hypothetical protein
VFLSVSYQKAWNYSIGAARSLTAAVGLRREYESMLCKL